VLALYAELQVAGLAVAVATFSCDVERPIDFQGKPSSVPRYQPIWVTLEGLDIPAFFAEWAIDSYLRRSGWLVVYEGDRVRWKLAFYDAWCVLYHENFRPGIEKQAACQLSLEISAQLWEWNGIQIEHHSDLWWEKDSQVRKRALTPLGPILAPPSARNRPAERLPTPAQTPPPTAALSAITGTPLSPKPPKTALDPKKKPLYAPTIAKWYKKGGSIEVLDNGNWKFTDWKHNSVVYEGDEPNFDKYARQQVDIEDMTGDCVRDFAVANKTAPLGRILRDNTWHHKQNARTMQEVNSEIHDRFTHYGARHVLKKRKAQPVQAVPTKLTKRARPS
jgi:hypothetical protein